MGGTVSFLHKLFHFNMSLKIPFEIDTEMEILKIHQLNLGSENLVELI